MSRMRANKVLRKIKTKKILLRSDGSMTMNTLGELIFTMEIKTWYCFWRVPVWRTIHYIDAPEKQLIDILEEA